MNVEQLVALCILKFKDSSDIPNFGVLESEAAQLLMTLLKEFDYVNSIQFQREIEGKSHAYIARRLQAEQSAVNQRKRQEALFDALRQIATCQQIDGFFPADSAEKIQRIRTLLSTPTDV
uniref:hypothetical protein n=1 Tax=Thaumasiovibrio occultus TaxID=1891184 RepID=UPI000B3518A4|nr:hypothetical protein [Thaumasiovibrio occultus]